MSNIFYSGVDVNLREELNARGKSGFSRSTADLDYMLGKIANIELIAYKNSVAVDNEEVDRLGGTTVRDGRYLPTGTDGFLNDSKEYVINQITIN